KFGSWTLLAADGTTRSSTDEKVDPKSYSYSVSEVGQMVLSVVPQDGMSSKISVYRNGELVKTLNAQQYEFQLFPNDKYRFLIQYAYTKLGTLGVTSDPSGLLFRVLGPKRLTGKTPKTFENLPAGRYTIYMGKSGTCVAPAPQSVVVTAEGRVTKLLTLSCDVKQEAEVDRTEHLSRRALQQAVEEREARERGARK
ncbi:MAG TPA: hypothetical protein PKV72_07005, partial [Candidatus Peribacteria bacterium]|nr:hypothetical protein [Candidatus Peribacteria bacterium]